MSVTTTVGSLTEARALACRILDARLAACVQLEAGIQSLYRWQGTLHDEPEVRLVLKTLPGCAQALQALFAQHHPYQLPQFTAARLAASQAYAAWVHAQVHAPAGPGDGSPS